MSLRVHIASLYGIFVSLNDSFIHLWSFCMSLCGHLWLIYMSVCSLCVSFCGFVSLWSFSGHVTSLCSHFDSVSVPLCDCFTSIFYSASLVHHFFVVVQLTF